MAHDKNIGGTDGSAPSGGTNGNDDAAKLDYLMVLRLREVILRTTLSGSQIYKLTAALLFPPRVSLGPHSSGWLEHLVDSWLMSRMLARNKMSSLGQPVSLPEWTLEMEEIVPCRPGIRLLRLPDVISRVGLRKTAIYDAIGRGEFPWPVPIGVHARAWVSHEIDEWLLLRIRRRQRTRSPLFLSDSLPAGVAASLRLLRSYPTHAGSGRKRGRYGLYRPQTQPCFSAFLWNQRVRVGGSRFVNSGPSAFSFASSALDLLVSKHRRPVSWSPDLHTLSLFRVGGRLGGASSAPPLSPILKTL